MSGSVPEERRSPSASDAAVVAFLQWSLPRLGLRWEGFRNLRGTVRKRLLRRMAELGIRDLDEYRTRLDTTEDEWRELSQLCRIPISRLYRDRAVFDRLRFEILPECAEAAARTGRPVRIWSAGCASGEEPYTLAILWALEIAPRHPDLTLDLVATDIDKTMIARAKQGCYAAGSLRELPATWKEAAFDHGHLYCVRDAIRRLVTFRLEDMREVMPDGPFDILLCRNSAFTYFDEAVQAAVLSRMIMRLQPDAVIVVGTHEIGRPVLSHLPVRAPCIYGLPFR